MRTRTAAARDLRDVTSERRRTPRRPPARSAKSQDQSTEGSSRGGDGRRHRECDRRCAQHRAPSEAIRKRPAATIDSGAVSVCDVRTHPISKWESSNSISMKITARREQRSVEANQGNRRARRSVSYDRARVDHGAGSPNPVRRARVRMPVARLLRPYTSEHPARGQAPHVRDRILNGRQLG